MGDVPRLHRAEPEVSITTFHLSKKPDAIQYNKEHHHSGIAYLTPGAVYFGEQEEVLEKKQKALDAAFAAHPERFVKGRPLVKRPPTKVWINDPSKRQEKHTKLLATVSQTP